MFCLRIIDLTHAVSPDMPVYPGTEPPRMAEACTLEKDGFKELLLTLYSHTGTHMDSPAHLFNLGKTLDAYDPGYFYGRALALDVSSCKRNIEKKDLLPHEARIKKAGFLLFYTGWEKLWGSQDYFSGFPVLSQEAARWLARQNLKAVGVDAISVDPAEGISSLPVHRTLLGNEILIIENLANLHLLIGREFTLCCLPLKIAGADGAPVRALAVVHP